MTARKVRRYVYTDQKGRPKLLKVRFEPKQFRMYAWSEKGQCWVYTTKRQEAWKDRALYRLPEVMWALQAGAPVYWCEGEKDADAITVAIGVGGGVGTTHWQGACNATAEQAAWFSRGTGPVFVVVDVDNAGAACGLHRRRLLLDHGANAKRVRLLAPPHPHRDAADAIMAGHKLDDFREVTVPRLKLAAAKYMKQRAKGKRGTSDWYGRSAS
jgi:DNA primase